MSKNKAGSIPIIDIFAGPGGLGEGFSEYKKEQNTFRINLSIEKDPLAHQTLTLRSFFRQFKLEEVPEDYYDFVKGKITLDELYDRWPQEAENAKEEAWCGTLGDPDEKDTNAVSDAEVDERIRKVLDNNPNWLLIGGPPCQAYSIVGRSRRQETLLDEKKDKRVGLYKQYLRILAVHSPAVFVMENVKGILSARTNQNPVFTRILDDLSDPAGSYLSEVEDSVEEKFQCPGYKIYSFVKNPGNDFFSNSSYKSTDFTIKAEDYGIPQTRHRVILLGIRKDIDFKPSIIRASKETPISKVLFGLPRLRSGLSKTKDTYQGWKDLIDQILTNEDFKNSNNDLLQEISRVIDRMEEPVFATGGNYLKYENVSINYKPDWFLDVRLDGVTNHMSKSHMDSDIHRYLFVACYGKLNGISPKLDNFPFSLLPAHLNVQEGIDSSKFADRFRVQIENKPSKTITSHISKDGHYYIHPDATQCRSLTVREAARIQTFPDNYYFCGPRTSQFHQVGNAVPPYLAYQMAGVVCEIFQNIKCV